MEKLRENWPIWIGEYFIGIASIFGGLFLIAFGYKWSNVLWTVGCTGGVWEVSRLLRRLHQRRQKKHDREANGE